MDGWQEVMSLDFWVKVIISVLCGIIVGVERQIRGKPVGIRTSTLVCLSTMSFIYTAQVVQSGADGLARVLGQIVTGVGFLGAGVIMTRNGLILGVTSAAIVWLLAAAGAAIGFGKYGMAVTTCVVGVLVLIGVERLEEGFAPLRRGVHAHKRENEHNTDEQHDHEDNHGRHTFGSR